MTLVAPFLLGDCNQDGVVNFSDIPTFIALLQYVSFLAQADTNEDGAVDFADIPAFIAILIAPIGPRPSNEAWQQIAKDSIGQYRQLGLSGDNPFFVSKLEQ